MLEVDHSCAVPGCSERNAGFGVERIVRDPRGNRQHGVDLKYFCLNHLAQRDAYSKALNGAPEGSLWAPAKTQERLL